MEALEGYGKIFEHSKYFEVEENQICVDDSGNVKIWVNADLSINFPNSHSEHSRNAPEDMVEAIVNIVASNTDPDTEPSPSFRYPLNYSGSTSTRRKVAASVFSKRN
jgi:hypothetical protein